MANRDAAFGLKPIRHLNGTPWNGVTQRCLVEDSDTTAVFIGDPVIVTGTAGSDDTSGLPVVTVATAGDTNRIYGVVVSVEPNPDNLTYKHIPASTGGYVNVCNDPDVIFIVQDDAQATLDGGSISANAVLAAGSGGSTVTGKSSWELDASDAPAADASNQVLILDIYKAPNNALGDNCIWEVLISNHVLRGGQAANNEGALGIAGS